MLSQMNLRAGAADAATGRGGGIPVRVALAVLSIGGDPAENLQQMLRAMGAAARARADLVLFAEAAFTGLANDDDPAHDLPLGTTTRGAPVAQLRREAERLGLHTAFGFLERSRRRLYDAALLLDRGGRTALHYRRITPGWHGPGADPRVYAPGRRLAVQETAFGRTAFLICGDLFDDSLVDRLRALGPDLLLVPFARSFPEGGREQRRWRRDERPAYLARAARVGATTLLVNYLDEDCFGGATLAGPDGRLLAELPLGRQGLLVADI